jgi:hypothetical protein
MGNPTPYIVMARDRPADQGGYAQLTWTWSDLDAGQPNAISSYIVWRSVTAGAAEQALRSGAKLFDREHAGAHPAGRLLRSSGEGTLLQYWEYVGEVPATEQDEYTYDAATPQDSLPGSNPYITFMVDAASATDFRFWSSPPESTYSVDNLAPAPPAPFVGGVAITTLSLHWRANTEPDLAGYRLYRGATPGFTPGPSTLISAQLDTAFAEPAGLPAYYKLSATDVHGNEGAFASLSFELPTGVPARTLPTAPWLGPPSPNPARTATRLTLSLPLAAAVRVSVFDQQGRRIRRLIDARCAAGISPLEWDLTDDRGSAVRPGIYFVWLETGDTRRVARMAVVR